MKVREAEWRDLRSIREFCCTAATDGWRHDIELGLRQSLQWRSSDEANRRVTLLVEGDDLVGVARLRPFFSTHASYGWTIELIGIALDHHDKGLGTAFFSQILWDFRLVAPGGIAGWFIHEENGACLKVADNLGAVAEEVLPSPEDHVARAVRIPAADAQLPEDRVDLRLE